MSCDLKLLEIVDQGMSYFLRFTEPELLRALRHGLPRGQQEEVHFDTPSLI
jgi:hypothetical protein